MACFAYPLPWCSLLIKKLRKPIELGWHFDNSSFAITLLIQNPEGGDVFEYIENMRDADAGDMNDSGVSEVFAGQKKVKELAI